MVRSFSGFTGSSRKTGYARVAKSCPDVDSMGDGDVEAQREHKMVRGHGGVEITKG